MGRRRCLSFRACFMEERIEKSKDISSALICATGDLRVSETNGRRRNRRKDSVHQQMKRLRFYDYNVQIMKRNGR
jgi:hypothetical protein